MTDLFSDGDLDQEKLEKEREEERLRLEAKIKEEAEEREKKLLEEKAEEKSYDKTLYILDGYSIIYRSYFAFINRPLTDKNGENVSAYFGFFNTVLSLLKDYPMDYLAVTMDEKEPTFRHRMFPEYKANREKAPEDLHAQVPMIIETLNKMGIRVVSKPGFEADDVIASLTREAEKQGIRSVMFTGDKDLMQLVCGHVHALRPAKKGETSYQYLTEKEVTESYGVAPDQIVDYLTLLGDTADNVPGVKGIGEKTAVKLLTEYRTLENCYRKLEFLSPSVRKKLEAAVDHIQLTHDLIKLSFDAVEPGFDFAPLRVELIDRDAAREDFLSHQLRNLEKKLSRSEETKEIQKKMVVEESRETVREDELQYRGKGTYELLTRPEDIRRKLDECVNFHSGIIAFDTETTGLEDDADIVGFSFSYELMKSYYCPLIAGDEHYLSFEDAKSIFADYFTSGKLRVIGQNIKYDLKMLWRIGEDIRNIEFDTMVAAWMLESNQSQFSLDDLALRYLEMDTIRYEDTVEKGKTFASVPLEAALDYGAEDSDITFRLWKMEEKRLAENGMLETYRTMENPLIRVLARMETKGLLLDRTAMDALSEKSGERIEELEKLIYEEAGHEFNINSTQQLSQVLFEEMGLTGGKKTSHGYSTDQATLEGLLRTTDRKIIPYILEYRQLRKLKGTYIDTLPEMAGPDGRVHTSFLQTGTATGRLSSRNPNLQNIPVRTDEGRMIRSAFVPAEGYEFISADYSQIELVVLAHLSGDAALRQAFIDGVDVHRYTAALILGKEGDEVTADERRIAKSINFGIMYGMSAFRLSNELDIPRREAQLFIEKYFARYNGIKDFVNRTVKSAAEKGYVETMYHHRRQVVGINSANKVEQAAANRVAVNTVIQGSASEIMKRAMLALPEELLSCLALQIHDELIFEVKSEDRERLEGEIKSLMENTTKLSIPVRSSVENGKSWGEMH